ncbi:MAG: non-lysosomal glucosylceramidase [Armatimonadetes bacterium]|nr:non-lysosomal glucosylceramidase [Armatimonadota bacterium]
MRNSALVGLWAVWLSLGSTAATWPQEQAQPPIHWDFEDGTLQGWQVVSGNLGPQPTASSNDRWGGNFGKQGRYFIGTYELPGPDGTGSDQPTGELRSPVFTLNYDHLSFLIGGGAHGDATFMALVDAETGHELLRATGRNTETMRREVWDVSAFKGRRVYLRIVDAHTGGWGHVNVDDIREITPEEWQALERERRRREAEARRRLAAWQKDLLTGDAWRIPYKALHTARIAMPLGGIGTGCIYITGTGDLTGWQIANRVNLAAELPHSFLAVWVKLQGRPAASRVLQVRGIEAWPGVEACEFGGIYPVAELTFRDAALPLEVRLRAWSPIKFLDARASSVPAVVLKVSLRATKCPAKVGLLASLTNAVGWDGVSEVAGVRNPGFGGNVCRAGPMHHGDARAVWMARENQAPDDPTFGTMVLAAMPGQQAAVSAVSGWQDLASLRKDFDEDGALQGLATFGPTPAGESANGAVSVSSLRYLRASDTFEATFVVAWHFPNRLRAWDWGPQEARLRNVYANYFADADSVARYVLENEQALYEEATKWPSLLGRCSAPPWLMEALSVNMASIRTPLVMHVEDPLKPGGVVGGFEGLGDKAGCCPLNCTHVYNYAQTMAYLWPELERVVREIDLGPQMTDDGGVRHRLQIPLSLPREHGPFADGHLSTILKAYREVRNSADLEWLKAHWPAIRKAMDFALNVYDPDGNGVMEGEQWNTYDCAVYGPNTFIGSLYLAALRAAEEMARLMEDTEAAARFRSRFEVGRENLDRICWREDLGYYVQVYDAEKYKATQYGTGCLSDQLIGQWWAHTLDLGYILPPRHVRQALRSIYKYNFKTDWLLEPYHHTDQGRDKGLLNCTWPFGGRPVQPIFYCDGAWTGVEYQVAAHMIYEGMVKEGLTIARGARERYDGARRNPYDEYECGHHYARPMSSWSVLLALSGLSVDGPQGELYVRSLPSGLKPATYPLVTPWGWGTATLHSSPSGAVSIRLQPMSGTMRFLKIRVRLPKAPPAGARLSAAASLKGVGQVPCAVTRTPNGEVCVTFAKPLLIPQGGLADLTVGRK